VSSVSLGGFKSAPEIGVTRGRLKVTREDMMAFFAPSIKAIKDGLETVIENQDGVIDVSRQSPGLCSTILTNHLLFPLESHLGRWTSMLAVRVRRDMQVGQGT
jgi:hypothetical protein